MPVQGKKQQVVVPSGTAASLVGYSVRLVDSHGGHETFGENPLNVNL
jgi:hypothetical protein